MATWIKAEVIENRSWNRNLFSLVLDADVSPFIAGQFTKLALEIDGKLIQRAYSYVNPPDSKYIEIYATKVADGQLTPHLHNLQAGDTVMVSKTATGFFTLDEVPNADHLWMLSTGTAIGPFLSILQSDEVWQRFRKVVLVHGVRFAADLSYQETINELKQKHSDQIIVQPFVSREPSAEALSGRITHALEDGTLERVVGFPINAEQSQVMLCGNPSMVKEIRGVLEERGLQKNLRRTPGQITTEQYW